MLSLCFYCPVCPWHLMDDLGKQYGTSSILHQALCIISKPYVNSNWRNSPEALSSGLNRGCFVLCDLEIWQMTWKNNRAPLLATLSFVHHYKVVGEFKLELQSGNAQFGSKSAIFCPVRPWNLTDDLENNKAPCVIASSCAHHFIAISEWSYNLAAPNLAQNRWRVCHVWPWNLTGDLKKPSKASFRSN